MSLCLLLSLILLLQCVSECSSCGFRSWCWTSCWIFLLCPCCSCGDHLCCAVVGPWILSSPKKGDNISLGDAILISGRGDTFEALRKEWNILAVHNVMCHSWKQTPEERQAAKQLKIQKAKERDERTRSSENRLYTSWKPSKGGSADRNRSSSKGSKGRSKGGSRGPPRSQVSWKGKGKK